MTWKPKWFKKWFYSKKGLFLLKLNFAIMKKLILLFLLFANVHSFAQDNAAFVGKWQVVFLKDNSTYIDIETDSFSIKSQMENNSTNEKDTDASTSEDVKSFLKETINGMRYTFNKDNTSSYSMGPEGEIKGSYKVDAASSTVELKEGSGDIVSKMKYRFFDNKLELTPADGNQDPTIIIMKKVK